MTHRQQADDACRSPEQDERGSARQTDAASAEPTRGAPPADGGPADPGLDAELYAVLGED